MPESVRMILVLNPMISDESPLTLPPSVLHVTLTTPYRSTIAITRLARFIAECKGLVVPEGDFGSNLGKCFLDRLIRYWGGRRPTFKEDFFSFLAKYFTTKEEGVIWACMFSLS